MKMVNRTLLLAKRQVCSICLKTDNNSYWAGLYYYQQRAKGCSHQAAVRALAFKWIRILYRCWISRTPYDESKYLKTLQQRESPLLKTAEAA